MVNPILFTTRDQWCDYIGKGLDEKKELNLGNLELTDLNIAGLAEALKTNKSISNLNLKNNKITAIGAKAIAEALLVNQTLGFASDGRYNCLMTGVILLNGNRMEKEGVLAICLALFKSGRVFWTTSVVDNGLTESDEVELMQVPEVQQLVGQMEKFRSRIGY